MKESFIKRFVEQTIQIYYKPRVCFTQKGKIGRLQLFLHSKTDFWKREDIGEKTRKTQEILRFSGCIFFVRTTWWRRRESNPRPKILWHRFLRVQIVLYISPCRSPAIRLNARAAVWCMTSSTAYGRCTFIAVWLPNLRRNTQRSAGRYKDRISCR